jgi:hypothetical protein
MSDADVETDIRSLDPSYDHTLPRTAGRDVDEGNTLHLTSLSVRVVVRWRGSSGDRRSATVDVSWRVDQETGDVEPTTVEPRDDSIGIQQLLTALERADQAAWRWIRNHSETLSVVSINKLWADVSDDTPDVAIHDDLEVSNR